MPQDAKSGPDPSSPPTTGTTRAQLDDFRFETDFVELAARFTALSGGGFSREISADLALEVVLNEIVERACGATGATGAAIVLWREGELVCRASSGPTAPDLGARLDATTGLSGECVRTRRTQRCSDVLADERADIEASYRLGVRSVIVVPLQQGEKLLGLFELLSSHPSAFAEKDELVLEALASRALSNLERAANPPPPEASAIPEETSEGAPWDGRKPVRRRFDWVTWSLGAAVVVAAVLLGILVAEHFLLRRGIAATHAAPGASPSGNAPAAGGSTNASGASPGGGSSAGATADKKEEGASAASGPAVPIKPATSVVPPGGLMVSEGGKEIFRMPPGQNESDGQGGPPKGVVELSPAEAEDSLLQRVEPDYPEQARQEHIQGTVVLMVQIKANGTVEDTEVVTGSPLLVQASMAAVKQWRFKPHPVHGRPAPMQTKITLNFRLPQ